MDFSEHLHELCPIQFPVNANGMTFFDDEADQALWNGLDQEQAPDPLVCLCPEYSGHGNGALDNAGGLVLAGPSAENNMDAAGPLLAQAPRVIPDRLNYPERNKALSLASAEPAASLTPNPKLFTCNHCGSISAKTPRDFNRHLATKKHLKNAIRNGSREIELESSPSRGTGFRCPVVSCDKTFPRKDNLWRHITKMHGISGEDE
ncbi:hypothetical protein GE21DRAFT_9587 [Neurospora crassa]|uniref:C2H2-type domain-containing protein n=1 Tax=Neurospora crassa (strain ATCC 24698 / 74-OR23-1A / CBS 708.71 / DSM 1257 / FGSC 987) TaxID=367110 RepID=Q7RX02_NEUCR|nr:hypothetical protein NCU05022 [Neurospora crassa OR74A]EAA27055.1 hypothetical protein NCU05022 [Neurospora crassa OR74A]KHE80400.1 hypothetical protein GE21DRAFT_9587 [Neurospora crassa]|eukprot:XP_956291.1 hypothetical protein NCU05022 [Neurospora crassa OR74A]